MSEKEYLLSKISQVAGQINRHKNQQEGVTAAQPYPQRYNSYTYSLVRGSPSYRVSRGRGRGRGGRVAPVHRNRTLILNTSTTGGTIAPGNNGESQSKPSTPTASVTVQGKDPKIPAEQSPSTSGQQWVAKRDRHMQLINSAVYDQQAVARARAMEATRQEKLKRKSERQRLKLKRFLERSRNSAPPSYSTSYGTVAAANNEITIGDIKYHVSSGGNKLVKVSGDVKSAAATPRKAVVGGVTFIRSKSGNLWRSGLIRAKRSTTTSKISKPCKYFTMTGKCQRGMSCPYTHDPDRVAICPRFLQSNSCPEGDACDLSHSPTPHRVPACVHFLRGNCSNSNCRYAHIRVNPAAPICRPFATEGYCEKGGDCTERHVHECPEFDEKGVCIDKKCKLPHIERAGRRRMAAAAAAASKPATATPGSGTESTANNEPSNDDEDSDLSSDDDDDDGEAIDSDDVDSDALSDEDEVEEECFIQSDGQKNGHEVNQQLDFIHL